MQTIFNFSDFREYLVDQFAGMPKKGYGQSRRLAIALNVHTTLISQVIKGKKTFTMEQAAGVCEFLSLSDMETEYFLLLVQIDRAGSQSLRRVLNRQLEELRARSTELVNRLRSQRKLTEEERAIFYSDWTYSAIRQLTGIDGYQALDPIAEYFGLSRRRTKEAIEFLIRVGLCKEVDGNLRIGPMSTHVESTSAWVRLHHINWREKAIDALNREGPAKLHYTAPMTLSRTDAFEVRELIVQYLQRVDKIIEPSIPEQLYCLNIDWFKVVR
jgi:uncharacterized protein (TIGR02147 family)